MKIKIDEFLSKSGYEIKASSNNCDLWHSPNNNKLVFIDYTDNYFCIMEYIKNNIVHVHDESNVTSFCEFINQSIDFL